ncbi:MAG: TonB-dependent receptor, partial [Acidobacteriota bacterium]|nr:TonB-dependent receptor [Acidobacteriota bacterium]
LPTGVTVNLGEVTELPADGWGAAARGAGLVPSARAVSAPAAAPAEETVLDEQDAAAEASPRDTDPAEAGARLDGTSAQESFSAAPLGAGVEEDGSAGTDEEAERSAGPGGGWRSVEDGGRRAGAAYTFSHAAVREFRVQGQGSAVAYGSAVYGHGVGGVITEVSRSGGGQVHGMLFYTVRDSAWAAADPFNVATRYTAGLVTSAVVKPQDLRQQFGGRLGGPLRWEWPGRSHAADALGGGRSGSAATRASFLYAFDAQRRAFPAVSSPGSADFYRLTATQTALLATRGVSPAKTATALTYLDSLTGTVDRRADQTVNFGRLDWDPRDADRLSLEYNRVRWSNPAGARSTPVVSRGIASLGSSFGSVDMGVGRWVHPFGARLTNELRVQYGRELQYETPQTPLPQEPNIGPGGLPPEISIGPQGLVFGTPAGLGRRAYPDERRFEAADVLAWTGRGHLLQLGADFSAIHDTTDSLTNAEGTFSYDSGATNGKAGGLVDWITDYTFNVHAYPNGGCPSIGAAVHDFCFRSFSQSFGQAGVEFARQEWAGFVQDDWRVSPRLTVHAGVRYEYGLLPLPQRPNAALDSVFGARGATSVFPEDRNNFGPLLGVAWRPFRHGGGVVHAGYGVYFGSVPGITLQAVLLDTATAASVYRVRIVPRTETSCPQAAGVGFGYACSFLSAPAGVVASTTSAVVFDRRYRLPMVQQGTFSVEQPVGRGVLARVAYVTNADRQLPNSVDINIAPATGVRVLQLSGGAGRAGLRDGETFAVPVYTARVSPSFGPVTDILSNSNATYHGLTVEARRGMEGRVGFRAAWTWSKAIDFGQGGGATPRSNAQFDPFTVRYDKGLSALNFPHRVEGALVWRPGTEAWLGQDAGARALRAVAGGWALSAVVSETSGRGYSYRIFGGTRLSGGRESINGSGGSTVLPTVGRNTLRLPDSARVDLHVARTLGLRDGVRLRAAVDALNVGNHVNVTGVEQRAFLVGTAVNGVTPMVFQDAAAVAAEGLNVQPFGTHTSSGTSASRERQIEVSLRLEF